MNLNFRYFPGRTEAASGPAPAQCLDFLALSSWPAFLIRSVDSKNLASLPGSVPMALAILAAGPSSFTVLEVCFLLEEECEDFEEEVDSGWPPVILTELPPSLRVILGMGVWLSPEGDMEGVPPDTPILIFSLVWPGVPPASCSLLLSRSFSLCFFDFLCF